MYDSIELNWVSLFSWYILLQNRLQYYVLTLDVYFSDVVLSTWPSPTFNCVVKGGKGRKTWRSLFARSELWCPPRGNSCCSKAGILNANLKNKPSKNTLHRQLQTSSAILFVQFRLKQICVIKATKATTQRIKIRKIKWYAVQRTKRQSIM